MSIYKKKLKITVLLISITLIMYFFVFSNEKVASSIQKENINKSEKTINPPKKTNAHFDEIKVKTIDEQYLDSDNYLSLGIELLNLAQQGDPKSQYFLFKIFFDCAGPEELTKKKLEEYRVMGISPNLKHLAALERRDMQCAGFDRNNIHYFYDKNESEWLKKSALGGYPLAMSFYAQQSIALLEKKESFLEYTNLTLQSASLMLINSIKNAPSGEVFMHVADAADINQEDRAAWQLLACRTGYDCSASSNEWWRAYSIGLCLDKERKTECFDKADFNVYLNWEYKPEVLFSARIRSYEIEQHIKNKDFHGIGLDKYLKYIKK